MHFESDKYIERIVDEIMPTLKWRVLLINDYGVPIRFESEYKMDNKSIHIEFCLDWENDPMIRMDHGQCIISKYHMANQQVESLRTLFYSKVSKYIRMKTESKLLEQLKSYGIGN